MTRDQEMLLWLATGATQKSVAEMWGVSQSRANQIAKRAIKRGRDYWHVWTPEEDYWNGHKDALYRDKQQEPAQRSWDALTDTISALKVKTRNA